MQNQQTLHSGLKVMAKLLRHYEMNEAKVEEYLRSINAWSVKACQTLIKGAKDGMEKGAL